MNSLSYEFQRAANNRRYYRLLFLLVAWYILTDDADKREAKKTRCRKTRKPRRDPGPSP